jgi:hypothetical protein
VHVRGMELAQDCFYHWSMILVVFIRQMCFSAFCILKELYPWYAYTNYIFLHLCLVCLHNIFTAFHFIDKMPVFVLLKLNNIFLPLLEHNFHNSITFGDMFIQISLWRIWGFHGGDYEECHLLGYGTKWVYYKPTFWGNMSPPSSG